jgi:hypothetical protein
LHARAEASALPPEDRAIALDWVGARAQMFRDLSAQRAQSGGNISGRIREVMTGEEADAVIALVPGRVRFDRPTVQIPAA